MNWQESEIPADAQRPGEGDGRRTIVLHPAPVLKDITLDVAERGLRFMGVDLDDFMGRDGPPPEPKTPRLSDLRPFFETVLVNAGEYDVGSWPIDHAQVALGMVAGNFFAGCLAASVGQPMNDDD